MRWLSILTEVTKSRSKPYRRQGQQVKVKKLKMFLDSVYRSLIGNFPGKEIFYNRGQINLICTNLNCSFAYASLLPLIHPFTQVLPYLKYR
jgi:hypothetical protein